VKVFLDIGFGVWASHGFKIVPAYRQTYKNSRNLLALGRFPGLKGVCKTSRNLLASPQEKENIVWFPKY
jgi:hypothetical protein